MKTSTLTPATIVLSAHGLSKSFIQPDRSEQLLFSDLSMTVYKGEIVAIVGASGTGKSTLLHLLGGLDMPTLGKVSLYKEDGAIDITSLGEKELADIRNRSIGFVFQFHHLLPEFSVVENIMMPALIAGKPRKECREHAQILAQAVGLIHRLDAKPATLSGGEQQRTAFARALMMHPDIVLADEPTGNLDEVNSQGIFELIQRLREQLHQTFIIVTHSVTLARQADRVLSLQNGLLTQQNGVHNSEHNS